MVSAVVPVYAGAKYLQVLVDELGKLRSRWEEADAPMRLMEVILVDDAATDASPEIIDQLSERYSWVTAIHLARNFGQHPATIAGILHSSGDWIVTLDEDLQHPPTRIEDLLRQVARTGSDIVYANAQGSVHENYVRDLGSVLFKRLIERFSGNPNVRNFNSFRLMRGSVARAASSICTHDTYFDVALSWFTQRVASVSMELKDERFISEKKSGYKLSKLLSHARRMLMSSGVKVIRLGALAGLIVVLLSIVVSIFLFFLKILSPGAVIFNGWTSLMLTMIFIGGIITTLVGIILEYLSLLVLTAHGKPIFFVIDRSRDVLLRRYFS
jgi:undecaprenyl-phosphate 4-deoxy-4-formamido-L-arabinose transferase